MQSLRRPLLPRALLLGGAVGQLTWLCLLVVCWLATLGYGMTDEAISSLRQETRDIFYHGFDNYMQHAFPEDELRPLSCAPLTRDRQNPAHIEVNDVLGNYSLTLIDSLSTLAILASSPPPAKQGNNKPLNDFQDGIKELVELYGDGSDGSQGQGKRARGFDLDSKVQVFETVIRGVGGLLSAHQFAVGDLPIRGYEATVQKKKRREGVFWRNGLVYDGQLLRLATDLANRLMPAFHTPTGLPYPRVNLRHGIPFYANSPYNNDAENGQCSRDRNQKGAEITETCAAGAGSLMLEFSTLSRLTGDSQYEIAAKNAFWAVWHRRSNIGLVGAGIDSETGEWVSPFTGIGAGIDSFFEYSLKTHILLSGLPYDRGHPDVDSPDAFLKAWQDAHDGIKRHVYRGATHQHPHYIQVDLYTGAMRAFWVDSLSAFYQGLLTLAGELNEAIETHLLYTALWTRYSAMPERWSTSSGNIESGLRWWGGRPEFIESTWYLYRATQDPWYLHVGEMALRDIKRRCFTKCGWAGLQDVRTGDKTDRMESFFLGETAKYLYLLFDPTHPLNTWDAPFVFTTEGHPLIIPKRIRQAKSNHPEKPLQHWSPEVGLCALPPESVPFSISATAARPDVFHAASLARLHLMPTIETLDSPLVEFNADHPSISMSDVRSPSNYTYYPWTLPPQLVPQNGMSSVMATRSTFDLSFPNLPNTLQMGALQRVHEGILVNSMSGLRLGMVREKDTYLGKPEIMLDEQFRIYAISNVALGRDEKVYMQRSTINDFNPLDPFFTRTRDPATLDLMVDVLPLPVTSPSSDALEEMLDEALGEKTNLSQLDISDTIEIDVNAEDLEEPGYFSSLLSSLQSLLSAPATSGASTSTSIPKPSKEAEIQRHALHGTLPTGPGAAPLPDVSDPELQYSDVNPLLWHSIYVHPDTLCDTKLPPEIARNHQIIVVPRGGCSFSQKLHNIPAYPPKGDSLQIVVIVSFPEHEVPDWDWETLADEGDVEQNLATEEEEAKAKSGSAMGMGKKARDPAANKQVPPHDHEDDIDEEKDSQSTQTRSKMSNRKPQAQTKRDASPQTTIPLVQPLLDENQYTPSGLPRPNPIPLIMVSGGHDTIALLKRATSVGVRRRYYFLSQGVKISNLIVL